MFFLAKAGVLTKELNRHNIDIKFGNQISFWLLIVCRRFYVKFARAG